MELLSFAFFLVLAAALHFFAYSKGYFKLPYETVAVKTRVSGKLVLLSFAIYWVIALVAGAFLQKLSLSLYVLQLSVMLLILALLYLVTSQACLWKEQKQSSPLFDWAMGLVTWFLSFPLVTAIGELSDWLITKLFGAQAYEQTAVRFLKKAAELNSSLVIALLTIVILAPLIEELLFRGVLQSYLKSKLGSKAAILLSALTFSLFHFSPSQGLGNISLCLSLLILGIYLGFLYERQRSLFASIGLHMTFNTISTLRILFSPETA